MLEREKGISPLALALSYFTRHKTAANLIMLLVIALGAASYPQLRSQFFPDVVVERVNVVVNWDGAGAEDIDNAIVQLLEPSLLAVEGVESTSSVSNEGNARITLEFEPGWDMQRGTDDVRAAVDATTGFPEDSEEPRVQQGAWRDRVTDVVISGPVSVDLLSRYADEFVVRLFGVGVTRSTIRGIEAPMTIVEVPERELIRSDVSLAEVASAIGEEAETDPAGEIAGVAARVRTGIEKRTADEIESITVRSYPDGSKLYVGDVGRVLVEGADRRRAYYVGENPAVSIRVDRSDRGDAIALQRKVEAIAADISAELPQGVKVDLIRTRAEAITGRLNILFENGALGLLLVVTLLFLFLNARTAFWVAAGIPTAMMATVAMMYAFGFTLNMISLFALIISLGMVVDDAIVVGEHADFRARNLGESPVMAAENAAARMFAPVFAATITTIIAFYSITTISGRFGSLLADLPFTIIVVLAASLLECFIILPNHMRHALTKSAKQSWFDLPSLAVNKGFNWFRERLFRPFIAGVVALRYPVVAGAVFVLATQAVLVVNGQVPWRFFNAPERGSVSGNFAMLPGASRSDALEMMRELQRAAEAVGAKLEDEFGSNPLTYVLGEVGGNTGRGLSGASTKDRDLLGSVAIELIDADFRPYSSFEFVAELQSEVRRHPLLETLSFRGWRGGPGGDSLSVEIYGASAKILKGAAEALKTELARYPEVSAVEDDLSYDKEDFILDLKPQGNALGFSIDGIARVLKNRLGGVSAATFPQGNRTGEIRVRLPEQELTADFLERTFMRTAAGEYVPLADIVRVKRSSGFSTVKRQNGIRLVKVTGDISEDDPKRAEEITREIEEEIIPRMENEHGVASRFSGLAEQEREFLSDAKLGFAICLIGIFLTLAWIFSSWTRPIIVLAIIPFGLIGAIHGHNVWDVPLSIFSVMGLIGLSGIIVNDSIVLVSTVDEYSKNRGLVPAIVDAATDRLRPVLLTTLTTVFGLAPLLYESSQQASFLKPTVITLCYGLGFGLVLVLLVVPSLLAIHADIAKRFSSLRRAFRTGPAGRPVFAAVVGASLAGMALLISTIGSVVVSGDLPQILAPYAPQSVPKQMFALATFAAGFAVICLAAFFVGSVLANLSIRRRDRSLRRSAALNVDHFTLRKHRNSQL
ncbi:MAG: efflux RND transporter permease subunit [Albidovulum sp.]|nr:efflux RND transporter permease subunit [Albidovulum sp.]